MTSLAKFELLAVARSGLQREAGCQVYTAAALFVKRKRPPAGELPEAALAAVRSRDARRRGSSKKPYSTKGLTTDKNN